MKKFLIAKLQRHFFAFTEANNFLVDIRVRV